MRDPGGGPRRRDRPARRSTAPGCRRSGLRWQLAVDGISAPLLLLTAILGVGVVLHTLDRPPQGGTTGGLPRLPAARRVRGAGHLLRPRRGALLRRLRARARADVGAHHPVRRPPRPGRARRRRRAVRPLHRVRLDPDAGRHPRPRRQGRHLRPRRPRPGRRTRHTRRHPDRSSRRCSSPGWRSRCRSSRCTPGCRRRTRPRPPPARCCWRPCCSRWAPTAWSGCRWPRCPTGSPRSRRSSPSSARSASSGEGWPASSSATSSGSSPTPRSPTWASSSSAWPAARAPGCRPRCSPTSPTASSRRCSSSSSAGSRSAGGAPTSRPRGPPCARSRPRLGFALVVGLAASLGLPGLAGFWGEFLSVYAAWSPAADRPEGLFRTLAVVAALGTVLAAAYALRVAADRVGGGAHRAAHRGQP